MQLVQVLPSIPLFLLSTLALPAADPVVAGVVNAGDYTAALAPGSIFAIFGSNLAAGTSQAKTVPLPSSLSGATVEVVAGGVTKNAPLFFVSAGQINAQLPYDITGSVQIRVRNATVSNAFTAVISDSAPRLFSLANNGKGDAIAVHQDNSLVTPDAPAKAGEYVTLYLEGLGAVRPVITAGNGAGDGGAGGPLNTPTTTATVSIAGKTVTPIWQGLTPYGVGLYQINFQVPQEVVAGSYPIIVQVGAARSQGSITMAAGAKTALLMENWNTLACATSASSSFQLAKDAYVSKLQAWYNWTQNETAVAATVKSGGTTVFQGDLTRGSCDSLQASWCLAEAPVVAQWPAGQYSLTLSKGQMCGNSQSGNQGFVRLSGIWNLPAPAGWQMLGQADIGASGGKLTAPGVQMSVAAGAFTDTITLSVARSNTPPARDDRVSDQFMVRNFPVGTSAPITVTLDQTATGDPAGDVWIMLTQAGSTDLPAFVKATTDGAKITFTIPATLGAFKPASAALAKDAITAGPTAALSTADILMYAIRGWKYEDSPNGFFTVLYDKSFNSNWARQLGRQLDSTKAYLETPVGLSWKARTKWPILIFVYKYNDRTNYGAEGSTFFGLSNQCINLNTDLIKDEAELAEAKITSSHELFHVLQNLYDPRAGTRQAMGASSWLWMDEAGSTWMEKNVATNADFVPARVKDCLSEGAGCYFLFENPLQFTTGTQVQVQRHGYGSSMFLSYLVAKTGSAATIGKIFQQMAVKSTIGVLDSSEYNPVQALAKVLPQPIAAYWAEFGRKWMEGDIFSGVEYPDVVTITKRKSSPDFEFTSPTAGTTLTYSYPDLSAQIFRLKFSGSDWPSGTRIKMTPSLSDPSITMHVFGIHSSTKRWIGSYTADKGAFYLENAETFVSNKEEVYILVANGNGFGNGAPKNTVFSITAGTDGFNSIAWSLPIFPAIQTWFYPPVPVVSATTGSAGAGNRIDKDGFKSAPAVIPIVWTGQSFSGSGQTNYNNAGTTGTISVSFSGKIDNDPSRISTSPGTAYKIVNNFHMHYESHLSSPTMPDGPQSSGAEIVFDIKMNPFPVEFYAPVSNPNSSYMRSVVVDAASYVGAFQYKKSYNDRSGKVDTTWVYDSSKPIKSSLTFVMDNK